VTAGPSPSSAVDAARRQLREATDTLAGERVQLASLEQEARALKDEIALMEGSAGRRLFLNARARGVRLMSAVTHPLWTLGSIARRIAAKPPLRDARESYRHLRKRSLPLRLSAPVSQHTNQPPDVVAIQWVGPMTIRHVTFEALLCHPASRLEHRLRVRGGTEFVTACAISPLAWAHAPSAVEFQATVRIDATGWSAARTVAIDPAARFTDRRWHELRIPLPSSTEPADVTVALETRVVGGGSDAACWAVFGEPRFEWRRPGGEVRQSLDAFTARLRSGGLREALSAAKRAPSAEEAATLYARWVAATTLSPARLAALQTEIAALPHQPLISVITPVYNTDPQWLRACVESVRRQAYPNWEHCLCDDASTSSQTIAVLRELEGDPRIRITRLARNGGISAASNAALALARGEFVALLDHDDELTPDALAEVVRAINAEPGTDVFYSDEDKLEPTGERCEPFFKPDWSPEHFLHCMYTCHLFVARRSLVTDAGSFRTGFEGAQDYDLLLRLMERTTSVGHIPRVLYHWRKLPESTASAQSAKPWAADAGKLALEDHVRRRGVNAEVLPGGATGLFRIRRAIIGRPLVSIVIPTAGMLKNVGGVETDLVAQAIASVTRKTTWDHYEFIVVADAHGLQDTTVRALEGTRHRVLRHRADGPFNFSRKVNEGVAAAEGEHVLLFNDDLEAIDAEWMSAMLEYSQDPAVGAVGPLLLYPDGRLQHVGMLLGVNGIAAHAFHQHPGTVAGYFGSVMGPRNYSAVTGACLMSRRSVFLEAGGFDDTFPIDFNDVDYCLRLRRLGYRIVFTPYARLLHHESASFGARQQDPAGIAEMKRRWANEIQRDPYYNPNLTREFPDYRLKPPTIEP
jgi:GT2 family glycosyltransferase